MAERIFRLPASQLLGQPVQTLLPDYPDELLATFLEAEIELCLKNGQESRYYTLEISPLNDWRGLAVGRLLMMRDVTEQKQSQAQILEQQRALAMLKEDEQLARELHDSLGQVLGYAHLTLEAARKLIADGKLTQADDHLAKLAGVMANAHADVREYILNLRTAPTQQQPFFTALQHYLNGYYLNYGIPVDLMIDTELDERILAPETQMQLFRILQEAFSNARQHAATNSLQVSFIVTDSRLHMHIQDNGQGFDPQQVANLGGEHFGLHIMRERAEQLGGCLRIESAPGKGTRVEVEVPVLAVSRHNDESIDC
jgi:signal transduction histidine kinase